MDTGVWGKKQKQRGPMSTQQGQNSVSLSMQQVQNIKSPEFVVNQTFTSFNYLRKKKPNHQNVLGNVSYHFIVFFILS